MLLQCLIVIAIHMLLGCETTKPSNEILLFLKPKGSAIGKIHNATYVGSNKDVEVIFPQDIAGKEMSIAVVVSQPNGDNIDNPGFSLYDSLSDLKIDAVVKEGMKSSIRLGYKKPNLESPILTKDISFTGTLLSIDLGSYDRKSCQSIFLPTKGVHITNHHCMSTQEQCSKATLTGVSVTGRCSKILYSNMKYDVTVFTTNFIADSKNVAKLDNFPTDPKLAVIMSSSRKVSCKIMKATSNETTIDTVVDENGSLKLASMLYDCDRKLVLGDSGSPVISSEGKLLGMIWGYYSLADDKQAAAFVPSHYLNRILRTMPQPLEPKLRNMADAAAP
ncbi:hypothetical protein [Oligoflexus sp.]|uniref:hypothetical protein n=1 Tax=Oligoflexus sp. TaxID=1971216 RepID=UPI002D765107|nr:hypothetical protein [Oligoflexus sp.]